MTDARTYLKKLVDNAAEVPAQDVASLIEKLEWPNATTGHKALLWKATRLLRLISSNHIRAIAAEFERMEADCEKYRLYAADKSNEKIAAEARATAAEKRVEELEPILKIVKSYFNGDVERADFIIELGAQSRRIQERQEVCL